MGLREARGRYQGHAAAIGAAEARALRARWRTASLAAGWPFPGEWALAEVDHVCTVATAGRDLTPAVQALGRARARAGAGLAETLSDLAALHAALTGTTDSDGLVGVDPDATPSRLLRLTALSWAEVAMGEFTVAEVSDGLTGLSTAAYLRTRLAELYREATVAGSTVDGRYALLTFRLGFTGAQGWSRSVSMVLLADVLRAVFDAGETLAGIGPSVVAVLARAGGSVSLRAGSARWLAEDKLAADPQLRSVEGPWVQWHRLPATHEQACALLAELARG